MTHAIRIHATGGPDAMKWEEISVADPGAGQARVRHTAVGVNYIDTYHRSGLYPLPLPATIGMEAAGVVDAVGAGVSDLKVGDRVAYCAAGPGAYSEARVVAADRLVKIPAGVNDQTAAAMMLKGLTAQYLLKRTFKLQPGDACLVHAAAGGVGTILVQWAKAIGATVIATVGNDDKAKLAKAAGADHVIVYSREDFAKRVRELTGGEGVAVVYDGVGKATIMGSLDSLRPLGLLAMFGNASGAPDPLNLALLSQKGSLFVTRPTLMDYVKKRADLVAAAADLFDIVASGKVKITVSRTYPLKDAAQAHRDLEARATTGSLVLLP